MGENIMDFIADVVMAIRADAQLRECFIRILGSKKYSIANRSSHLLKELHARKAPTQVKQFVRLLVDEQIASQILELLQAEEV